MIVFSSPVPMNRSGRPEVASGREKLRKTPWWNITLSVFGAKPLRGPLDQTRSGFMRTIQPSTGGFSAPAIGL